MNPVRSSLIILQEPAFHREDCPDGTCHWCGHPLRFTEAATWHNRQRVRHKGDEVEHPCVGFLRKDCDREFRQSMVWNGQNALRWQAWQDWNRDLDPVNRHNRYKIYCVDCGDLCETGFVWVPKKRVGFATRNRSVIKKWEADHEVEIWDGGKHELANLRSRCCECHSEKTERERKRRIDSQCQVA